MRLEHRGSAVVTTITSELSDTGMTISCADLTGWPTGSPGPFYACLNKGLITEEKVLLEGKAGNQLQVFVGSPNGRGRDDTVAQTHPVNSTIEHIWTAAEADEANAHINSTGTAHGYPDPLTVLTTASDIPESQVVNLVADLNGKADITGDTFTGVVKVLSGTATGPGSDTVRQIFVGTGVPSDATDGQNGDLWIRYT